MVMGGDSCSKGRGFQSKHQILDGHIPHIFLVKIVMIFALKRLKINDKETGLSHF